MKVPALVKRAGWNLGDQIISSLTNAVLSFLVARSVSEESFGGFAIAFTIFGLVIGGSRAISTSPLNIRFSDATGDEAKRAAAAATGNAFVLGIVSGVACVAAGLFFPGSLGQALMALGVVMPALLVQDAFRYVFFSRARPALAALNDAVWAVVQIGAVTALLVVGMEAVGPLLLAWGVSAAAAALLAVHNSLTWPDPRHALGWVREHRDLTGYLLASFATAHGCNQGAILVIASIGSVEAVGSLRGAQILLGPTTILASAAFSFAVPEFSRRRADLNDRQWMLGALAVSGFVAGLGFVWGSIFLLAPDSVGAFLLGETWPGTSQILLAAVLSGVASGASVGAVVMLYALNRASSTLTIQAVLGSLTFLGGVGGVFVGGAVGAQWGFALANVLVVPFWFYRLRRELRRRRDEEPAELLEPEDTTLLPAVRQPAERFLDDYSTATMSTMLLPRVEARKAPQAPARTRRPVPERQAAPAPAPRPPVAPGRAPIGPPAGNPQPPNRPRAGVPGGRPNGQRPMGPPPPRQQRPGQLPPWQQPRRPGPPFPPGPPGPAPDGRGAPHQPGTRPPAPGLGGPARPGVGQNPPSDQRPAAAPRPTVGRPSPAPRPTPAPPRRAGAPVPHPVEGGKPGQPDRDNGGQRGRQTDQPSAPAGAEPQSERSDRTSGSGDGAPRS